MKPRVAERVQRPRAPQETELDNEPLFIFHADERTLERAHEISLRPCPLQEVALQVWEQVRGTELNDRALIDLQHLAATPELARAYRRELEEERLLDGEETGEVRAFAETREATQEHIRTLKGKYALDYERNIHEVMPEEEKAESALYRDVVEIVERLVAEMGFQRPVNVEITRAPVFNAFVLRAEAEGEQFQEKSEQPMHVFIHSGLILEAQYMFGYGGKEFTKDHLASILAHELRHLRQPKYQSDKSSHDVQEIQRREYDADAGALEDMDRAGYNPRAFIEFHEVLMKRSKSGPIERVLETYLSNHPANEERMKELQKEFHRPDRVFFSAEKDYEQFSSGIIAEAERLTRKEFLETLQKARTIEDWHRIFDQLENDPKETLRSVEIAMSYFNVYADARLAIAAAEEEWRTGRFGLRDAMLFRMNAAAQEFAGNPPQSHPHTFDILHPGIQPYSKFPDYQHDMMRGLEKQDRDELHRDFIADAFDETSVTAIAHFSMVHGIDEPLRNITFHTWEEAFDPENLDAQEFWKKMQGRNASPESQEKYFQEARAYILKRLACIFRGGVEKSFEVRGDDKINKKEALVNMLREALKSPRGQPLGNHPTPAETSRSTSTFAESENATTSFGAEGVLKKVLEAASQRVHRYTAPSSPRPDQPGEREKRMEYNLRTAPYRRMKPCSEKMFQRDAQDTITQEEKDQWTPLQQLTARALRIARTKFEQALSAEQLQRQIGHEVPDDVFQKDWLFREYYGGHLFRQLDNDKMADSIEDMRKFFYIPEYAHVIPFSLRSSLNLYHPRDTQGAQVAQYTSHIDIGTAVKHVGDAVKFSAVEIARHRTTKTTGEDIERLRFFLHAPDMQRYRALARWGYNSYSLDSYIDSGDSNPQEAKRKVFMRWLKEGLPWQDAQGKQAILKERARAEQLPEEFYLPNFYRGAPKIQSSVERFRRLFEGSEKRHARKFQANQEADDNIIAVIDALADQSALLYAALGADDREELDKLHRHSFREYFV